MRPARWLSLSIAALIGILALPSLAIAQDALPPDTFLDRLDRARALARLDGETPSSDRMAKVRSALGLPVEVVIDDWSTVIPGDPVLDGLTGTSVADFERAEQRLASLSRTLSEAVSHPGRERADLDAALVEAYRGVVPPRPDPLTLVLHAFDDALQAILQRIETTVGQLGDALAWFVLIGIVVLAVVALLRSDLVPDRQAKTSGLASGGVHSVDWAARGEAALRAGDLHEAVRAFYVALLVVLAARGIVADAPALTAGEARVAVRRLRPELFPQIAQATDTYERVVYGGDVPDARDIQHLRDAMTRVRLR